MKTLHVINGLGTGGAERSLAEMLPRLRQFAIDPTVACLTRRNEGVEQQVVRSGVTVEFVPGASRSAQLVNLRRLVHHLDPMVVHTTIFEADQLGRLAALGRTPVLTSLVNTSYVPRRLTDPNVQRWRLRAVQATDRALAPLTTHFHAISGAVRDDAVRRLGISPSRITVIPRGRDRARLGERTPRRRREVRRSIGLPVDAPVILNVGRQEHQKGQEQLLIAASRLRQARSDVIWLIAGREGNASPALRRMWSAEKLEGTVRFLGHRDDVPDLLCAADLFVFPSLFEGLGGAILEAMALGLPVVASDIPAIREALGPGNGRIVPVGDSEALSSEVLRALDEGHDEAAAQRLKSRFKSTYNLDEIVARTACLLHAVGERSSLPRPRPGRGRDSFSPERRL